MNTIERKQETPEEIAERQRISREMARWYGLE